MPMFRVTLPYLNLQVKPLMFSGFLEKKYNFMHLPFKMHKTIFFWKKICVPTLPKIFRPYYLKHTYFLFGLTQVHGSYTNGNQGSHRLEKYLNIQDCLEKSLKIKFALKSTGKNTQRP